MITKSEIGQEAWPPSVLRSVSMMRNSFDEKQPLTMDVLRYGIGKSELGTVLVASGNAGAVAVLIGGSKSEVELDLQTRFRRFKLVHDQSSQKPFVDEVISYIRSPHKNVEFKVDLRGTPFQRKVWQAVMRIPFGETKTYATIAEEIGHGKAVRAVGAACTVNPYAFVVPCHRVLHSNPVLSFGHKRGNDRMRPMVLREQNAKSKLGR